MPEDVVQEQEKEPTETELNADSPMEDILEAAQKEAETEETPSTPEQPTEDTSEEPEKAETTEEDKVEDKEKEEEPDETEVNEGDSIPYQRFNKVIKQRNDLRQEMEKSKEAKEEADQEIDETKKLLEDPDVLRLVLKKQGLTKEAIAKELTERGLEPAEPETPAEYDFTKTEDWKKYIEDTIKQNLSPVQQTLTKTQQAQQQREIQERLVVQETDARKLAKDAYDLEYGDEAKDLNNLDTGVGKINAYLTKHPQKMPLVAQGVLTKSDILHLALEGKAIKLGERKGIEKEKKRQEKLKNAAMESNDTIAKSETPDSNWSVEEIAEWMEKHPDKI